MLYDTDDAEGLAQNFRDFIEAGAPEEVGGGVAFLTAPPEEFVPEERQGKVHAGQVLTWCGPVAEAEAAMAPLLEYGAPVVRVGGPVPYQEFQKMLDDPPGFRNYWSAEYVDALPDEGIEIWARFGREQRPSPTQLIWLPWGGAVTRGPDSAVGGRDAKWVFHPLALWENASDDDFWVKWCRSSRAALAPYAIGTSYLNFRADVEDSDVPDAHGEGVFERLVAVKTAFDPDNVFHLNNNIKPR